MDLRDSRDNHRSASYYPSPARLPDSDFDKLIESSRNRRRHRPNRLGVRSDRPLSRPRSRYRRNSPRITDNDKGYIASFAEELVSALGSRTEFDRLSRKEVAVTAKLMYLYGIASLGELRNAKARSRTFFVGDLRKQRYEYRDMKILLEVMAQLYS